MPSRCEIRKWRKRVEWFGVDAKKERYDTTRINYNAKHVHKYSHADIFSPSFFKILYPGLDTSEKVEVDVCMLNGRRRELSLYS